jgi:hypothetical protein
MLITRVSKTQFYGNREFVRFGLSGSESGQTIAVSIAPLTDVRCTALHLLSLALKRGASLDCTVRPV